MQGMQGYASRLQFFESEDQQQQFNAVISSLERYELKKEENQYYAWLLFDYQNYLPLNILQKGLQTYCLRIYHGQRVLIAQMILQHYQLLRNQNIEHGNLEEQNIIIKFSTQSQKITTFAQNIEIEKVHFTSYKLKSDQQRGQNDTQQLKKIIISLLQDIENEEFQQLQKMNFQQLYTFIEIQSKSINQQQKFKFDKDDQFFSSRKLQSSKFVQKIEHFGLIIENIGKKQNQDFNQIFNQDQSDQEGYKNCLSAQLKVLFENIQIYYSKFFLTKILDVLFQQQGNYFLNVSFVQGEQEINKIVLEFEYRLDYLLQQIGHLQNSIQDLIKEFKENHYQKYKFDINLDAKQIFNNYYQRIFTLVIKEKHFEKNFNLILNENMNDIEQDIKQLIQYLIEIQQKIQLLEIQVMIF